jgi:hypothetical protein
LIKINRAATAIIQMVIASFLAPVAVALWATPGLGPEELKVTVPTGKRLQPARSFIDIVQAS